MRSPLQRSSFLRCAQNTCAMAIKSKLQSCLKRDHARGTVAAQSDAEQSRRRRCGGSQRPESRLRRWASGDACIHHRRQRKIRMIEKVERLCVQAKFQVLAQREPFGEIKIAP